MAFRLNDDELKYLRTTQGGADLGRTLADLAGNSKVKENKNIFESIIGGIGEKVNDIGSTLGNIGKTIVGGITENSRKQETKNLMSQDSARRNEIAKKYGYASYSDAMNDDNASQAFWDEIKDSSKTTQQALSDKTERDRNSLGNVRDIDLNQAKGQALSTIGTVLDLAPGFGVAGNIASGIVEGVGDAYKNAAGGGQVSLQDALARAGAGGLSAAVSGGIANKLGAGKTILGQAGKSAISGGLGGATAGGVMAAANGGNILEGVIEGGKSGAAGGALMGGGSAAIGKVGQVVGNKIRGIKEPIATIEKTPTVDDAQVKKGNLAGRALKKTGETMETAQTNLTRAERNKLGIKNTGEVVNKVRKRTGMSSVQDQAEFARNITGAGDKSVMDTIQKYNMAQDNGKPITLTTDKYEVAVNDAVKARWRKSTMGESYDDFRDNLIKEIKSTDPITASNMLKDDARMLRANGAMTDPKNAVKAEILTDIAKQMDDLSYSVIPEKNVNRMFDDTIDEFRTRAQEAKAQGNNKHAKAYTKLADELENTPRTIKAFRSFKKDFVDASNIANITSGARSGSLEAGLGKGINIRNKLTNTLLAEPTDRILAYAGGKISDLGDVVNGVGGIPRVDTLSNVDSGITGYLTGKNTIDSPLKGRATTAALNGIADNVTALDVINPNIRGKVADLSTALQRNIGGGENINSLINIGNRIAARGIAQNQVNNAERAKFEQEANDAINNAVNEYGSGVLNFTSLPENLNDTQQAILSTAAGNIPQTAQTYAQEPEYTSGQSTAISTLDRIGKAAELALNAGDLTSFATLLNLYKQASELYGGGNTSNKLNATQQNNLAKLEAAGTAIDELESLYNQAGGGQGRIGGNIAEFGAKLGLNNDASAYNSAARGLINQIAAAVGKTDSLNTEGEVQRAMDLIPKITDTPEEASVKLESLRKMLNANKQTYADLYGVSL